MTGEQKTRDPAASFDLLADIGGTNTRMALAQDGTLLVDTARRFSNNGFSSFDAVLRHYLKQQGLVSCKAVAVAMAGPVQDGAGTMTNLNWHLDRASLAAAAGAEQVVIINDLQAQGYGLDALAPADLVPILPGKTGPQKATRLVIGLGTGCNASPVYHLTDTLFVPPSEAGHTSLPLQTKTDVALARFITSHGDGAAVEDLLSGYGLAQAYAFFSGAEAKTTSPDPGAILKAASAGNDPAASQTLRYFATLLGRVCGDLALTHLPFGGIFLVGGVGRAVTPFLAEFGFSEGFLNKGQFTDFMGRFALTLVQDDAAALHGCAHILRQTRTETSGS